MKFIGLLGGEFKILDNVSPTELEELKSDFSWIDIGRIDPKTELTLKSLYGIENLGNFDFPTITQQHDYDTIVIPYFEDLSLRYLKIILSTSSVITVHQGSNSVCDEAMASVNEMIVSGNFNPEAVLLELLTTVVERQAAHLHTTQDSLRTINAQLKDGLSDLSYLAQLNKSAKEIKSSFYDFRAELADIVTQTITVKGLNDPKKFADLYGRMNLLCRGADDFSEIINGYLSDVLPVIWTGLSRMKGISMGLSAFSLFIALAAFATVLFPDGLLGINIVYISLAFLLAGLASLAIFQRPAKFTAST
jgi:hypothetical protein